MHLLQPEIIEGFRNNGCLKQKIPALLALDQISNQRTEIILVSCRPFASKLRFYELGESSQWTLLMDDELAIELEAEIFGAIPAVYSYGSGTIKSPLSDPVL